MAKVKTIPDGYPRVTPYLHVDGASAAIEFYSRVFGATERMRMPAPGGKVGHAELQIGDSLIMQSGASIDLEHDDVTLDGLENVVVSGRNQKRGELRVPDVPFSPFDLIP